MPVKNGDIMISLLTRRRDLAIIIRNFDAGGNPHTISTKSFVKYLEISVDKKLTFEEQFQRSCEVGCIFPIKAYNQNSGA